jgi:hypothetical protein
MPIRRSEKRAAGHPVLGFWHLGLLSDHANSNRLALAFRILQPHLLRVFLLLEGLRQGRKFAFDVLEEQLPLDDFDHEKLIAPAAELQRRYAVTI